MGSRRRGEGRKKCSFSLRLSCLWEPSRLRFCRMPSLCPARRPSLKGLRCVSLCPFVSPTAYVCARASILTCTGTAHSRGLPPADASPPLSPIEAVIALERSAERGMSVGMEERAEQIDTERGGGGEARGDRRHFHITLTSLSLSFLSLVSHSFCASLVLSLLSSLFLRNLSLALSQQPFPPHSLGSLNKRRQPRV